MGKWQGKQGKYGTHIRQTHNFDDNPKLSPVSTEGMAGLGHLMITAGRPCLRPERLLPMSRYFARLHTVGAAVGRPSEGAGTLYFNSSPATETLIRF